MHNDAYSVDCSLFEVEAFARKGSRGVAEAYATENVVKSQEHEAGESEPHQGTHEGKEKSKIGALRKPQGLIDLSVKSHEAASSRPFRVGHGDDESNVTFEDWLQGREAAAQAQRLFAKSPSLGCDTETLRSWSTASLEPIILLKPRDRHRLSWVGRMRHVI